MYSKKEWPQTIKLLSRLAEVDSDYSNFQNILEIKDTIPEEKVEEIIEQVYNIESFEALKVNLTEKMHSKKYSKFSLQVFFSL